MAFDEPSVHRCLFIHPGASPKRDTGEYLDSVNNLLLISERPDL
jgi:hypothetical protein